MVDTSELLYSFQAFFGSLPRLLLPVGRVPPFRDRAAQVQPGHAGVEFDHSGFVRGWVTPEVTLCHVHQFAMLGAVGFLHPACGIQISLR